jgi:hypothetical protein
MRLNPTQIMIGVLLNFLKARNLKKMHEGALDTQSLNNASMEETF